MHDNGLINLKVANDGFGLRNALETQYEIVHLEHIGNFVFQATCKDQVKLEIQKKPVDLMCSKIRIISIVKLG